MTKALVVGCAECVWDDVKRAQELFTFDKVYCVKLAGVHWPTTFDFWITLHPEYMDTYEQQRKDKELPGGYQIVGPLLSELPDVVSRRQVDRRVSYRWPGITASASSGIFGAKVAIEDGHKVVLAGIPFDQSKHFSRGKPWFQKVQFDRGFDLTIPLLVGKVKSMSGRTRELLGEPTVEWAEG